MSATPPPHPHSAAGSDKPKLSPRQPAASQQHSSHQSPTLKPASGGSGGSGGSSPRFGGATTGAPPNLVLASGAAASGSGSPSPTHGVNPNAGGKSTPSRLSTTSKPVYIERRDSKQHAASPLVGNSLNVPPNHRMERRNSTDGTAVAESKASKKLWDSIESFFKLIDIDNNGSVDINEAHASLTICLANVKNSGERLEQVVKKQVKWLFQSADENKDQVISLEEFQSCYRKLLRAGYEPEVLQIDIDEAIKSLGKSRRMSTDSEHKFFVKCSKLFHLLDANRDGVVSVAEARSSLLLCFAAVQNVNKAKSPAAGATAASGTAAAASPSSTNSTGSTGSTGSGSGAVVSPTSAEAMVDKQVAWLFSMADVNGDKVITESEFLMCYKKLLAAKYEKEVLEIDLDRAIGALEPIRAAEAKRSPHLTAASPASTPPPIASASGAHAAKSAPASTASPVKPVSGPSGTAAAAAKK